MRGDTIASNLTIPKGKSFCEYLINAYLESDLPCVGSSVIMEYKDINKKKLASFFYMPGYEEFKSVFCDVNEYASINDKIKIINLVTIEHIYLNGKKIINLEFQKKKNGLHMIINKTDEINRPMSSPIFLFSGNYAKEYMSKKMYSTLDKLLK